MGLGQSNSSACEEKQDDNTTETMCEKSMQSDLYKTEVKDSHVHNDQITELNLKRDTCNGKTGPTSATQTLDQQTDKLIVKRNYSARIIREKEKLLKEKEETIRQQANLIKTQNELLGQRKCVNISNIGSPHYDVIFKPCGSLKSDSGKFSRSATSHENVQSSGVETFSQSVVDNYYGKNYFFDGINVTTPTQELQSNQIFNLPSTTSFTDPQTNRSTLGTPFQNQSHNSTSLVPYQPTCYASHISYFNVPPPNLKGLLPTPTPILPRKHQNNEYRRNNTKRDEVRDDNRKESTNQLFADLEKHTNYELEKLNNAQIGKLSNEHVDVKKIVVDRKLKQVKSFHGIVKCPGCAVTWKCRASSIGTLLKCKKCGSDVGSLSSRMLQMHCKSNEQNQCGNKLISKSEKIADVD